MSAMPSIIRSPIGLGSRLYFALPWYHSEPAPAPGMSKDGKSGGAAGTSSGSSASHGSPLALGQLERAL